MLWIDAHSPLAFMVLMVTFTASNVHILPIISRAYCTTFPDERIKTFRQERVLRKELLLKASLRSFEVYHDSSYSSAAAASLYEGRRGDRDQSLLASLVPSEGDFNDNSAAHFRPYQTMLLLREEADVLGVLPPDSSYQLIALIKRANPLKTFQELSVTTGIPL